MIVLGIESSCDETAASIVRDDRTILSNIVFSQLEEHQPFGGVVPEIAARAHLQRINGLIEEAMNEAEIGFDDLDAIAATCGPGLIGGVLVGAVTAKTIAAARELPFVAVNHLEGHALTPRLTDDIAFPYLLLLVSGGHTQLLVVENVGQYKRLGTTIDDAVGEAFDKTAKMMDLGYPGGPLMERTAQKCKDPEAALKKYPLPRPLRGRKNCDFSFSGLKTAVLRHVQSFDDAFMSDDDKADLAYSFQVAVCETIEDRCKRAIQQFVDNYGGKASHAPQTLVVSGGVAANKAIRRCLQDLTDAHGMRFSAPPLSLCSDNAAMIAWAGIENFRLGTSHGLDFKARPRWPLDPDAEKKPGAGVKA